MFQQDYILRLISEAIANLAKLLKLEENNQHEEALEVVTDSYNSLFELTRAEVESFSVEELMLHFKNKNKDSFQFLELFSDFVYQHSQLARNDLEKNALIQKAYSILMLVDGKDTSTFSYSRKEKIVRMLSQIA